MKENNKPTILIVDDVSQNIQVLGAHLNKLDCNLAIAMNGQQAMEAVTQVNPDLILLDVMMPIMGGHEVCKNLKSDESTQDIPIIFLTAKTETEDIVEGFKLGAVDYIAKPFIGRELIARVKTHLALKDMKSRLQDEVATKNKFFSIISHDLRGSFGIILSFVQILQENRIYLTEDELNELLDDIGKTAVNTIGLLENLLEWARSQTGSIKFNPEKIRLSELVTESLSSNLEPARKKSIELNSNLNGSPFVLADKNMVLLVIRNLVSNAIKFTPGNGKIDILSEKQDNFLKVSVVDNGLGIESHRIDKLFSIDKKISTNGTNNEQGNGLGLILCKEFVERNGGNIAVKSKKGDGTTVCFTLPLIE